MSDFNFDIEAALNSSTYTPTATDTVKSIYGILNNTTISDETYAEYRQIIDNLPSTNIYSSVIQNPNSCGICNLQTTINNILGNNTNSSDTGTVINGDSSSSSTSNDTGTFGQQYSNVITAGTPVPDANGKTGINPNNTTTVDGDITVPDQNGVYPGNVGYQPTQTQIDILDNWNNSYESAVITLSSANSSISDYNDYTNKLISNLPTFLGIIQTALALENLLSALANPCLGIQNFLSSITSAGQQLIAEIEAALKKVADAIGGALETIMKALAVVTGLVAKLINLMENEIKNLIEAMIAGLQYGLSNLLAILANDPCLSSLVSILGTSSLLSVI